MSGGELFQRISSRQINPYTEADAKKHLFMIVQAVQHLHSIDIVIRQRIFSLKKSLFSILGSSFVIENDKFIV